MLTHIQKDILGSFKVMSVWKLIFLILITYGVYAAHYVKNQSDILNGHLDRPDQISAVFVTGFMILSYFSLGIFIVYLFTPMTNQYFHAIDRFDDSLTSLWQILLLVWVFKFKNRVNRLLGFSKKDDGWFSWVWALFFGPFYLNFKLNKLRSEYL